MSIADKLTQLATAKQNIKQAIIDKGVDLTGVPFTSYHTKIAEISGEGGDPGETPADGDYLVRFFDYDGTILKEEWVDSGEDATPPNLPDYSVATNKRPALTFQGWNNSYTNITGNKDIGAIYIPTDGKTHAFVRLTVASGKDVTLYFFKTDPDTLSIDWGDGVTTTDKTHGHLETSHTYSDYGDYEIKIWISRGSGEYDFGGNSSDRVFVGGAEQTQRNMLMYLFIGDSVSEIGWHAFENCYSLTNIVIPESVSYISSYAFYGCYSLTSVIIPESVSSIVNYTFQYCYSLTNIVIPENVSKIEYNAFQSCYSLTSINLPANLSSMSDYAFQSCRSLTSIDIPARISSIRSNAFQYCSSLKSINLPANLSSIGSSAFYGCASLKSINLPANLSSIGSSAFRGCASLKSINLPANLSSIGSSAFRGCYFLTDISIPAGVSSIGDYAFRECYSLTSIDLPASVSSIGSYAFYGCYSLTSINIPANVSKIESYTFYDCHSILKYVFNRTTPPTLSNTNAFNNINSICKIYVPDESVTAYKTATNWVTYADYIYPISEMESD